MKARRILYIGQIINPKEKTAYSGASNAGVQYEWNLVHTLSKQGGVTIHAVSIPPVAGWPKDKRFIYPGSTKRISDSLTISYPGFVNLPVIKQITQIFGGYALGAKIAKREKADWVMSYNTYPQVGVPAYWLSRKSKGKHICVLADVPFDDRANQSFLRKLVWKLYGGLAWNLISKISNFVILNPNTADLLPQGSKYCVIEGAIDPKNYPYQSISRYDEQGRKIILYSGAITEYSGVATLIEAVKQLPSSQFVLHIYGNGDLKDQVQKEAESSENIVYCGSVPIEKMRELQANAWLLVNPRKTDNIISRYTFPSKILEYMASGTPVLTTNIDGLPEEYPDLIFFVDDDNSQSFINKILNISKIDPIKLHEYGANSKKTVIENKNWDEQSRKIRYLLDDTEKQ